MGSWFPARRRCKGSSGHLLPPAIRVTCRLLRETSLGRGRFPQLHLLFQQNFARKEGEDARRRRRSSFSFPCRRKRKRQSRNCARIFRTALGSGRIERGPDRKRVRLARTGQLATSRQSARTASHGRKRQRSKRPHVCR